MLSEESTAIPAISVSIPLPPNVSRKPELEVLLLADVADIQGSD